MLPTVQTSTVHKMDKGVVRTKFVLHPAYAKLAKGIDALNGVRDSKTFDKVIDPLITRETFLRVMARHPAGLLVQEICEALLKETKSKLTVEDIRARVYAMLVREVNRGMVEPDHGKGKRRKLTAAGHKEASLIEADATRRAANKHPQAGANTRVATTPPAAVANGVFDYAKKIGQSISSRTSKKNKDYDQ